MVMLFDFSWNSVEIVGFRLFFSKNIVGNVDTEEDTSKVVQIKKVQKKTPIQNLKYFISDIIFSKFQ